MHCVYFCHGKNIWHDVTCFLKSNFSPSLLLVLKEFIVKESVVKPATTCLVLNKEENYAVMTATSVRSRKLQAGKTV